MKPDEYTPKTIREAATWRALRALALDFLCLDSSRKPIDLTQAEVDRLLAPHEVRLAHYFDIFVEITAHAKAHALKGVSVDQKLEATRFFRAVDYPDPPEKTPTEAPLMPHPRHGKW